MPGSDVREAGGDPGFRGRFSSKLQAVLLLLGKSLDALSRELQVNADIFSAWRASVLSAGFAALQSWRWTRCGKPPWSWRIRLAWNHSMESNPFMAVEHPVDLYSGICYKVDSRMGEP